MTEQLLKAPEATTNPDGSPEQKGQTAVADSSSEQQSQPEGQKVDPQEVLFGKDEPEKGEQKPAETTEEAGKETKEPAKAPEKYELKAPEGVQPIDEAVSEAFSDIARELDLSQDQAQSVLDKVLPVMHERQEAANEALQTQWLGEVQKLPAMLEGDGLDANIEIANKGIQAFGNDHLYALLEGPMGVNPGLMLLGLEIGKKLLPDNKPVVGPTPTKKVDLKDPQQIAKALFPNMEQG